MPQRTFLSANKIIDREADAIPIWHRIDQEKHERATYQKEADECRMPYAEIEQ